MQTPGSKKVSIGLPVFNRESSITNTIDSILAQTYENFELIISDNASTDRTREICQKYARIDKRVTYISQKSNIGMMKNFKFVLEESSSEYFMWWASDDVKSSNFIELNLSFLEKHKHYVASTSPNRLETLDGTVSSHTTFALDGNLEQRFSCFFDNCWNSHGVFYSLIRRDALKDCKIIGRDFFAVDWAIILHLVTCGKIKRLQQGEMISGIYGISSGSNGWTAFHKKPWHWLIPILELTYYVLELSSKFKLNLRLKIIRRLFLLNLYCIFQKYLSIFYQLYVKKLKK